LKIRHKVFQEGEVIAGVGRVRVKCMLCAAISLVDRKSGIAR
jgi:hypothetical protein